MSYVSHSTVINCTDAKLFELIRNPITYTKVMPPDVSLVLKSPNLKMQKGAEYEFKLTRMGLSQPWTLIVDDFKEPQEIKFKQILGYFSSWTQSHKIEVRSDTEVLLTTHIQYDLPFGIAGKLFDDLYFRRFMKTVVETAHRKLRSLIK